MCKVKTGVPITGKRNPENRTNQPQSKTKTKAAPQSNAYHPKQKFHNMPNPRPQNKRTPHASGMPAQTRERTRPKQRKYRPTKPSRETYRTNRPSRAPSPPASNTLPGPDHSSPRPSPPKTKPKSRTKLNVSRHHPPGKKDEAASSPKHPGCHREATFLFCHQTGSGPVFFLARFLSARDLRRSGGDRGQGRQCYSTINRHAISHNGLDPRPNNKSTQAPIHSYQGNATPVNRKTNKIVAIPNKTITNQRPKTSIRHADPKSPTKNNPSKLPSGQAARSTPHPKQWPPLTIPNHHKPNPNKVSAANAP